ncbi:MAG: hypothetical protein GEU93_09900 [Propionibacteriales bacterium]|nr:hypothetical protein [Propionibacteriales bacterium]
MTALSMSVVVDVLDHAGYRCQCHGECGGAHSRGNGRCPISSGTRRHRLVVAPANPTLSATAAAHLPASELRAWCTACLLDAERLTRHHAPAAVEPDLFEGNAA